MSGAIVEPTARILECSEREYYDDPCAVPSLNQTTGTVICAQSMLHAWAQHPKLGKLVNEEDEDDNSKEKKHLIAGKVIHKLLLGKGQDVHVVDAKDWRTNFAKDERDQAKAKGQIPVLARKMEDYEYAADFLRNVLESKGYDLNVGQTEVAFEWHEIGEHGLVTCRGRLDHIDLERPRVIDVKTIRSADMQTISRSCYDNGYDIQREAYTRCVAQYLNIDPRDVEYLLLFVEIDPPYVVTPAEFSPQFIEMGQARWNRAVTLWERSLRTNNWPDYSPSGVQLIEPQPWAATREIGSGNW